MDAPGDVARFSLVLPRPADRCELVLGAGVLARLPDLLATHAPAHRYIVISDSHVMPLHGAAVAAALRETGALADALVFDAGEASKTTDTWARLLRRMGELEVGRDACVIAVGGGVTCDLAGFVAATFARGLPLVHVPTSLLAMIDAAIGGKTGVDLPAGKNLVGAFHQPRLVVADPAALDTLPDPALREGLAEAVKHAAIADADALDWLARHGSTVLDREPAALRRLIRDSIRVKTAVVASDVLEAGQRAVLNFGHTIGHAIERASGYRTPHGAAVAIGLLAESLIGERLGVTEPGTADRVRAALSRLGLPTRLPEGAPAAAVADATRGDKKSRRGVVRYALLKRAGEPARSVDGDWTLAVPADLVQETLERL